MVIITLSLSVIIVFAWFIIVERTEPIIITTGSLRTSCKLYLEEETEVGNVYIEIKEAGINFDNVIPGQVFNFRMDIKNLGTIPGILDITMNDIFANDAAMYDVFKLSFEEPYENNLTLKAGNLEILEGIIIPAYSDFEFNFSLKVLPLSELKLTTLVISNFLVRLVQLH